MFFSRSQSKRNLMIIFNQLKLDFSVFGMIELYLKLKHLKNYKGQDLYTISFRVTFYSCPCHEVLIKQGGGIVSFKNKIKKQEEVFCPFFPFVPLTQSEFSDH